MGQRITRDQLVFGIPAIELRDTLKQVGNSTVAAPWFAERLSISTAKSKRLVKDLIAAGWVKVDSYDKAFVELTQEGQSYTMARATKPLRRAKADQLLVGAIEAAKLINADGTMPNYVGELYVFGSYLGTAVELGDLDLGLKLERRFGKMLPDQWMKWSTNFGYRHCGGRSYLRVLVCSEEMARRRLKQRSPYISLHGIDDLDKIKAERKLVFKAQRVAAPRPIFEGDDE